MTGNIGDKYQRRQNFGPASLERVRFERYDPLRQVTEGAFSEVKDIPPEDKEIFTLLLVRLMDRKGNIRAPRGSLKKLWSLAQVAGIVQEAFSTGKEVPLSIAGQSFNVRLSDVTLSIRGLLDIIDEFKNGEYELDYYIFQKIRQLPSNISAGQRAVIYSLLQQKDLCISDGWRKIGEDGSMYAEIQNGRFEISAPKNRRELKSESGSGFIPVEETVEAVYGEIPERISAEPDEVQVDEIDTQERIRLVREIDGVLEELGDVKGILEIVGVLCPSLEDNMPDNSVQSKVKSGDETGGGKGNKGPKKRKWRFPRRKKE